ncbi:hypothetical protein AAOGI_08600 [Agarivorans albus]
MTINNYRLYADKNIFYYSTFEDAKKAATKFIPERTTLRIEVLVEVQSFEADFWAYEYDNNRWVPS